MAKRVFYTYNPDTDDFERYYPSVKSRLRGLAGYLLTASLIAGVIYILVYYVYDTPSERNLRRENTELRNRYNLLDRRLETAMHVMEDIRNRDDNFYRVMMQMDPLSEARRYAGLPEENKLRGLYQYSDAALVEEVGRRLDVLERTLYTQSLSFDELQQSAKNQKDRMAHMPQILPIGPNSFSVAAGYGYRRDKVSGKSVFHEGMDLASPAGTPVMATGDGIVETAERQSGYGNVVRISHGYNYSSVYAHLGQISVAEGDRVSRGQVIGKVGSTGKSTGPHLHYEIRFKGEHLNPVNFYFSDLSPQEYRTLIQTADNAGHLMD